MAYIGEVITLTADGVDPGPNHTIVQYEWTINGAVQGGSTPSITHTLELGTTTVECRVQNDCGSWSYAQTIEITTQCPIPTIQGLSLGSIENIEFDDISVTYDGLVIGYGAMPAEIEFTVDGVSHPWDPAISYTTITGGLPQGEHTLAVRVKNDCGSWSETAYLIINVLPYVCPIPTITGITVS